MKGPGGTSPAPFVWMDKEVPPVKSGLPLKNSSTSTLLLELMVRPQSLERGQIILAWKVSCTL